MPASVARDRHAASPRGLGRSIRAVATGLLAISSVAGAYAQTAPREGIDFTNVQPNQPTDAPAGKVDVVEFFGYWCPACNVFESTMHAWAARNDAKVRMVYVPMPTHFRTGQANLQKLYYALDAMGAETTLRPKVFAAIHQQRSLADSADAATIADWVATNGIDRKTFVDVYDSFAVQAKVARANQLASAYGVTATPSLGVGGRYLAVVDARTIAYADTLLARTPVAK